MRCLYISARSSVTREPGDGRRSFFSSGRVIDIKRKIPLANVDDAQRIVNDISSAEGETEMKVLLYSLRGDEDANAGILLRAGI